MQKSPVETKRFNPFWVCLLVFAALGVDAGLRFYTLADQRQQLTKVPLAQPENVVKLTQVIGQRDQMEPRLQNLSLDLLQIAQTNPVARQIVQEFNISWSPPPTSAAPAPTNASTVAPK